MNRPPNQPPPPFSPGPYGPPPWQQNGPYSQPAFVPNMDAQPPWSRPGAPRHLQKRSGNGCVVALIVLSIIFVVVPIVFGVVGIVLVALVSKGSTKPVPTTRPIPPPVSDPVETVWKHGYCAEFAKERMYSTYIARRNEGSARKLHGKVLLIHFKLKAPAMSWEPSQQRVVDKSLILQARYLETIAKENGQDLKIDQLPWELNTGFLPTPFKLNENHLIMPGGMERYRDEARAAVELALGKSLKTLVKEAGTDKGYENVAVLIHAPITTSARNFAFGALKKEKDMAEGAFLFIPVGQDFGAFALSLTHETLHLFGADDLYRMRQIDPDEKLDIMDAYCTGYGQVTFGEATKYAIGWRDTPPDRPYIFEDW